MKAKKNKDLNFKKEAIYKIVIDGIIDVNRSDILGGMQITVIRKKGVKPSSMLIGEIKDQSALSGILNSLNDMQFTVISVNMLSQIEN